MLEAAERVCAGGGDILDVLDSLVRKSLVTVERAGGAKRLIVYEGQYHDLWKESDRDRVFDDMRSWLESILLHQL